MPPPSPVSSLTTRFSSPCGAHTCLLSLLLASVLNVISPEDHLSLTYFSEFYLSCFYDTTFSRKLPLSEKIALVRAPRHLVLPSIINTVMSVDLSAACSPLPLSLVTVIEKARSLAVSESLRLADRGGPSPQRRARQVVGPHGCALKVVPVIVHSAGDSCFRNPELPDGCGQLWPSARVPTSEFQSPSHGQDSQRTPWGQTSWREPKSFRLKQTKMK